MSQYKNDLLGYSSSVTRRVPSTTTFLVVEWLGTVTDKSVSSTLYFAAGNS
jgi:hypothetical protein